MPIDLSQPGQRQALTRRVKADIDAYSMTYDDGPRTHLGASLIGHECNFYLWATFRWLAHNPADGRMQRLFRRGHLEELRFIEYLRGIGFTVWDKDHEGKQFRIASVGGHFGGSSDGVAQTPANYDIAEPLLCEFKTKGTGAGFNKLAEKGMRLAAPQHFAQASTYGKNLKLRYCLYMVANKNDDDLYIEVVELDWTLAAELEKRAEYIITSELPPSKVSLHSTHYLCKMCELAKVCHHGELPMRNCRSCAYSRPIDGGQWLCTLLSPEAEMRETAIIPETVIKQGCGQWSNLLNT